MEQIIGLKSTPYYQQQQGTDAFILNPLLKITVIHTSGKVYQHEQDKKLVAVDNIKETVFDFTIETLETLITQLMVQKQHLQKIADNAKTLNTIIASSGSTIQ